MSTAIAAEPSTRADLAGGVVDARAGAGLLDRQVAGRGRAVRRPDEGVADAEQRPSAAPIHQTAVSGVITDDSQQQRRRRAQAKPNAVRIRGCTRSVSLPTSRASTIVISAIGTSSSAASVGLQPADDLRPDHDRDRHRGDREAHHRDRDVGRARSCGRGRARAAPAARCVLRACQSTNSAEHDEAGDDHRPDRGVPVVLVALLDAEDQQEHADAAERDAQPVEAVRGASAASAPAARPARTPTRPTGTLTKKIHSQPRPSTSTPPRIGPTSVATPAVAPHSAIAAPRRGGREDPGDDRHRLRRDHRGAEALHDPGRRSASRWCRSGRTTATRA